MRKSIITVLAMICLLCSCSKAEEMVNSYHQISAQQAKMMMEQNPSAVILDVREESEFAAGHIPGAVLLSVNAITEESAASVIPEKSAIVLVYCRSGNRSKTASEKLVQLGYSRVYEFGGINDWPYEVVR